MLAHGYGKIINTASMATLLVPHPQKQIAYNASKAAVVKITQTLGTEWADRGLNVNCISPGIVNTALIQVSCPAIIACLALFCSQTSQLAYNSSIQQLCSRKHCYMLDSMLYVDAAC